MIRITEGISISDEDLEERFVRASGPGGQNVNKVATAVELRFNIGRSSLPESVKERLHRLAGKRITTDGVLVIDSRQHRTQAQNRAAARARLVSLLQQASRRPRTRKATTVPSGAREQRLSSKKRRGAVKELRGRREGRDED